jgi:hypothetical protein
VESIYLFGARHIDAPPESVPVPFLVPVAFLVKFGPLFSSRIIPFSDNGLTLLFMFYSYVVRLGGTFRVGCSSSYLMISRKEGGRTKNASFLPNGESCTTGWYFSVVPR